MNKFTIRFVRRINGGWVAAVPDVQWGKTRHVRVWATPVQVSVRKHRELHK